MKTGFYVRIERNGKWGPADIGEMSDVELEQFFTWLHKESPERVLKWVLALAKIAREVEDPAILAERVENEVIDELEGWIRSLSPKWREDVGLNATEEIADLVKARVFRSAKIP